MVTNRLSSLFEWPHAAWNLPQLMERELSRRSIGPFWEGEIGARIGMSDTGVLVELDLPGFSSEDLDVTVRGRTLTVRGRRADADEGADPNVAERPRGSFERRIRMPVAVTSEGAEVTYDRGILQCRFERPQEQQPQRLEVREL